LGFGVQGFEFRVQGLGFGTEGLDFMVWGLAVRRPLLTRNVERFRGWLVFKAHRFFNDSTLGLRVIEKKFADLVDQMLRASPTPCARFGLVYFMSIQLNSIILTRFPKVPLHCMQLGHHPTPFARVAEAHPHSRDAARYARNAEGQKCV